MVSEPLVSIITPIYNGANFIAETIDSVLNAEIKIPFEYLVLNDGSSDQTLEILQSYGNRVRTLSHENIGESMTVNRGLENAVGKYILILSADDPLLTADLIHMAVSVLEEKSSTVAVYPDWKVIGEAGETLKINILPEYSDEIMIGHCRCLPGPGVVFRKDAALKIGGRRKKWKFVGDYDFWLRLSREGRIERLPGVLAQWRNNQGSTSISQRGTEMANDRIQVIEEFLTEHEIDSKLTRKALGNAYYMAARLAFFDPIINGRELLSKSFKLRRSWPEEAKVQIVIYLLLMPISTRIMELFPILKTKIIEINSSKV
jgi:hypothetical protein